ncbi:hypothetical protein [Kingella kingae]|uniref:hypothetical protein n=1 Tax=Kingella kingae TaxID=504 RepID=UPI0003FDCAE3|nr:hypothetical protein [Kingella kingae]
MTHYQDQFQQQKWLAIEQYLLNRPPALVLSHPHAGNGHVCTANLAGAECVVIVLFVGDWWLWA